MNNESIVLGAGITGLCIGYKTGFDIYEANIRPGGICSSYYMDKNNNKYFNRSIEETYRFEIGGGHWVHATNNEIIKFINTFVKTKTYIRNSAVYFSRENIYVPYPIQNHLSYLPRKIAKKAFEEIVFSKKQKVSNYADWLEVNFGKTLSRLFFYPFHNLYTAGLYTKVLPQDSYKTPINIELIKTGLYCKTPLVGYNSQFIYPINGLDELILKLSKKNDVKYLKKVIKIDGRNKDIYFSDGSSIRYKKILSTLPLNIMAKMADIKMMEKDLPYNSVMVINIGAIKGNKCPDYQWLYIPESKAGFHRLGIYSNVDSSFLPMSARKSNDKVSIYVEKAFLEKDLIFDKTEINKLVNLVIKELKEWKYISETEAIDTTAIKIAYCWEYPNMNCTKYLIDKLENICVYQCGRYGKWQNCGITQSIEDGLNIL